MVGTPTLTQEVSAKITQRITLHGVSWQTYTQLLAELGDHRASRLAYAQGVLEITMPSECYETHKKLLERLLLSLGKEYEQRGMRVQKVILRGPFSRPPTPVAHCSAPCEGLAASPSAI